MHGTFSPPPQLPLKLLPSVNQGPRVRSPQHQGRHQGENSTTHRHNYASGSRTNGRAFNASLAFGTICDQDRAPSKIPNLHTSFSTYAAKTAPVADTPCPCAPEEPQTPGDGTKIPRPTDPNVPRNLQNIYPTDRHTTLTEPLPGNR